MKILSAITASLPDWEEMRSPSMHLLISFVHESILFYLALPPYPKLDCAGMQAIGAKIAHSEQNSARPRKS